jgi:general secretion pathway protein C
MKKIPLISSFILFIALCATAAYWLLQFNQPPSRPLLAPPEPSISALPLATGLFGANANSLATGNFQLNGVVVADPASDSVAIIATDGKPAKAFRVNAEIQAGTRLKQVQSSFVLLEKNGTVQRLELPIAHK